jgi:hypothetical protein
LPIGYLNDLEDDAVLVGSDDDIGDGG